MNRAAFGSCRIIQAFGRRGLCAVRWADNSFSRSRTETHDVSFGFPLTRESKSWAGWLFGILGLGALYLAGEGVAEWIHARDNVKDPLRKRVWHLALLLAVVVVFWVASAALLSVNQ